MTLNKENLQRPYVRPGKQSVSGPQFADDVIDEEVEANYNRNKNREFPKEPVMPF